MTISQRLKQARKEAGFTTATAAAEAWEWNVNTYRSHENGHRDPTKDDAIKYARAFRKPLAWLLTGRKDRASAAPDALELHQVPIIAWGQLPKTRPGIGGTVMRSAAAEFIGLPSANTGPKSFALTIRDRSMVDPEESRESLFPGDAVIIDPDRAPSAGRNALVYDSEINDHAVRHCRMLSAKRAIFYPLNPHFSSIELDLDSPQILGRVTGVLISQD